MNIREQMVRAIEMCQIRDGEGTYADGLDDAACTTTCHHCFGTGYDPDAALSIFANPSDELVERCARALCEHEGCDFNEAEDVPSHISWVNQARAVLTAAVGEG